MIQEYDRDHTKSLGIKDQIHFQAENKKNEHIQEIPSIKEDNQTKEEEKSEKKPEKIPENTQKRTLYLILLNKVNRECIRSNAKYSTKEEEIG